MIIVFLLLLVAIPLTLTYLLRRLLFDKLNFSAPIKKVLLILTHLFFTIAFICSVLYFSFGPLFYGHRQAAQFYKANKKELHYLITKFAALERNGLFSISKSSEGNLKITLELSNGKGTTEFLVNDKEGNYEIARMSNNQPDLIYNPNQPPSLAEILTQNKIAEDEFNSTLHQFKKTRVLNIHSSAEECLIGIKETFPFQIAYLFFCNPESKDCNEDKGEAQIDKGVYFDKFSNP